jgi:hypothetical protein
VRPVSEDYSLCGRILRQADLAPMNVADRQQSPSGLMSFVNMGGKPMAISSSVLDHK